MVKGRRGPVGAGDVAISGAIAGMPSFHHQSLKAILSQLLVAMGLLRGNVVNAPPAGIVLARREQGLEVSKKRLTTN